MKKILMALFVSFLLFLGQKVDAQTYRLILEKQENIYYVRDGDILPRKTSQFSLYKVGDILAYCIEPKNNITTYQYVDDGNTIDLEYSDELKEKIELIGHYGREYPNHDNVHYSMAAQALIWELTGTGRVRFYTGINGTGEEIDVTKEREEIMHLVNNHQKLPNIPQEITIDYGDYNGYRDSLKLINTFEIIDNDGLKTKIRDDNVLEIISKKIGESTIKLCKKHYDEFKTMIFVGSDKDNSQTLARLRMSYITNFEIKVETRGIRLKINKLDENNQKIEKYGIKFKIKDLNSNEYLCENNDCVYQTNDKGILVTKPLSFGRYEIEELEQIVNGYVVNKQKQVVILNETSPIFWNGQYGNFVDVNLINKKVKGHLKLYKFGENIQVIENEIIYKKCPLKNVKFKIYREDNTFVDEIITNDEGYLDYDNLDVGKYYVMEVYENNDYIVDNNKYYFEIKQKNAYDEFVDVELSIENHLQKGTLKFIKIDKDTHQGIPNTIMEIYYDNGTLFLTKQTNNEGKFTISNMPLGKYYLVEKEANQSYVLTNEKVYFEIKNHDEIVTKELVNEKKTIVVPKTSRSDNFVVLSISGIFFLLGLGEIFYEKH